MVGELMSNEKVQSPNEFKLKNCSLEKEAKEIKHWLRMITKANPYREIDCRKLWQKAQELTLIFSSILL